MNNIKSSDFSRVVGTSNKVSNKIGTCVVNQITFAIAAHYVAEFNLKVIIKTMFSKLRPCLNLGTPLPGRYVNVVSMFTGCKIRVVK